MFCFSELFFLNIRISFSVIVLTAILFDGCKNLEKKQRSCEILIIHDIYSAPRCINKEFCGF